MAADVRMSSPWQAIKGGLILFAALFVAYDAWNRAEREYLRVASPAVAVRRSPTDMHALQRAVSDSNAAGRLRRVTDADARNARTALLVSPINNAAFRVIGMHEEQARRYPEAAAAFSFSERMSRRNAFVQLWLIEYAVAQGNVAQALKHYDAALSVKPRLFDVLFPILSAAMSDPAIRAGLRPYVARGSPWSGSLLSYAVGHGDPHHVMALLAPLVPRLHGKSFDDVSRALADRLVDFGDLSAAARVVAWKWPASTSTMSTLAVNQDTLEPQLGVFAWRLLDEQGISASANDQQGFDVTARPLATGVAATRVLPVSPGHRYVFRQTLRAETSIQAGYVWQGTCIGNPKTRPIWNQPVYPADQPQEWGIATPAGCTGIQFSLHVGGPDGQLSSTASVTNLLFRPR